MALTAVLQCSQNGGLAGLGGEWRRGQATLKQFASWTMRNSLYLAALWKLHHRVYDHVQAQLRSNSTEITNRRSTSNTGSIARPRLSTATTRRCRLLALMTLQIAS